MAVLYFCWLDILIQLRSTYHDASGRECVDAKSCARRYVTEGSFAFDLLCGLPFEAFAPLESGVAHSTEVRRQIACVDIALILRSASYTRPLCRPPQP